MSVYAFNNKGAIFQNCGSHRSSVDSRCTSQIILLGVVLCCPSYQNNQFQFIGEPGYALVADDFNL